MIRGPQISDTRPTRPLLALADPVIDIRATKAVPVTSIRMLGRFELSVGERLVNLPIHAQKVLGFLAVVGPVQERDALAGRLWPESSHDRAHASLRTALWRIRKVDESLVECSRNTLHLCESTQIDVHAVLAKAHALLDACDATDAAADIGVFEEDLVPGWDDDWLVFQRERVRQLRIHALEAMSGALLRSGAHGRAIEAAYAALAAEPLRDSAHACLISAHLAEGNRAEAQRHFESYRRLMHEELGLPPAPTVQSLIESSKRSATA